MRPSTAATWLFACLFSAQAYAKPVKTQSIEIEPSAETSQTVIPTEDIDLPEVGEGEETATPDEDLQAPEIELAAPEVLYDTSSLPRPVARMHSQMKEAALSGDIERLRVILESNEVMPTLSFTEIEDPIDFLRESSGDGEGHEILAILADTLDAGFVHVDVGTPQEMYVWPYFSRYPLDFLTPEQKVEMFRIVTAGDFVDMQDFGAWLFYRVGIGPDGTLHYFVAGD